MTYTLDIRRFYFTTKISDNIIKTDEGYLICKNVPFARTGVQEYAGQELGMNDKYDQMVKVYREPEDVFATETLASFEGKPFTDNHPTEHVDVNNWARYAKGHIQNIRRSDTDDDLLVGDIIVTDPMAVSQIENKTKRELSAGYDCIYFPYKDGFKQGDIRGNHVALVTRGRAGSRVSIKDEKVERKNMAYTNDELKGKMFAAFSKDASPEEVNAAAKLIYGEPKAAKHESVAAIDEKSFFKKMKAFFKDEEKKETDDEKVEVDDEEMDDESIEEKIEKKVNDALMKFFARDEKADDEDVEDEEEEVRDEEPSKLNTKDMAMLTQAIARCGSHKDRKRMADTLHKITRNSQSTTDGYAKIKEIAAEVSKKNINDSAPVDYTKLGDQWAAKYNPHHPDYKGDK